LRRHLRAGGRKKRKKKGGGGKVRIHAQVEGKKVGVVKATFQVVLRSSPGGERRGEKETPCQVVARKGRGNSDLAQQLKSLAATTLSAPLGEEGKEEERKTVRLSECPREGKIREVRTGEIPSRHCKEREKGGRFVRSRPGT